MLKLCILFVSPIFIVSTVTQRLFIIAYFTVLHKRIKRKKLKLTIIYVASTKVHIYASLILPYTIISA